MYHSIKDKLWHKDELYYLSNNNLDSLKDYYFDILHIPESMDYQNYE
jgi:hypothetical protein